MVRVEPESDVFGKEEALAKISMELLKTQKYKKILSDLSIDEINALVTLKTIAKIINSDLIENIIDEFLELRVSKDRLGRREILSFALSFGLEGEVRGRSRGIGSLFSGLKA